ncbi:hypothetical protein A1S_3847 [Acinetobacter baumannii ATCC 17978]|nr:hypothetical protein A1S_3847 [Acinetobacter baumannii ATCC 17978]
MFFAICSAVSGCVEVGAVVVAGLATVAEVGAGLAFCVDAAVGGVAGVAAGSTAPAVEHIKHKPRKLLVASCMRLPFWKCFIKWFDINMTIDAFFQKWFFF